MVAPIAGRRKRRTGWLSVLVIGAMAVLLGPSAPAAAQAPVKAPVVDQCTAKEWANPFNLKDCVGKLSKVGIQRAQCLQAPTPETPDAGMSGWFASEPESATQTGVSGMYSRFGYAGYDYSLYDQGCVTGVTHPTDSFEDTLANGEFMVATSIIGASNALREKAWDPSSLWGWADPLVQRATQSIYTKVFTVFGAVTLAIVGLYLLWRSRQSDMSNAMTTAGWAIFVMVAITAIAAWPVRSAHLADSSLVSGLSVVHSAIGPEATDATDSACASPDPNACVDHRDPAIRASDTVTETILYRNWLRGLLGSADSPTAQKYGPALYYSKSLTWEEAQRIENDPDARAALLNDKEQEWMQIAEQIKAEDPEAYSYLQGNHGMDRVGAGFIAVLSSLFFAMFDITASILVLIGFLIFRWAVIAAPVLGTVGLLRPASAGLRRLANAVIAAIFNIIIFGTGAAIYLYAVDLIMDTATLPGWLQVTLMWLCGVVGWLLLRPYRRITQMGGRDPSATVASAGSWHRRFFREMRTAARLEVAERGSTNEPRLVRDRTVDVQVQRPESRHEDPMDSRRSSGSGARTAAVVAAVAAGQPELAVAAAQVGKSRPRRSAGEWTDPDVPHGPTNYVVYRPGSTPQSAPARRPESSTVGS